VRGATANGLVSVGFLSVQPSFVISPYERRNSVPVYEYVAVNTKREDSEERGTVLAKNEEEAKSKVRRLNCDRIKVKRISGISGFFKAFTADIR
jgi:hypothetical protein